MQGYIQSILFTRSKVGDFLVSVDCKRCITCEYLLCYFACLQGCSDVTVITGKCCCTCYIQRIGVVTVIAVTYSHNLVATCGQSIITLVSKSKLAAMIGIRCTCFPILLLVFDNSLRISVVNHYANILDSLQSL